jgi:transposase
MTIVTVGIEPAKNVFALHGVDEAGKVQLRQPRVARSKLSAVVGALPPCTIGIEACTGAHCTAVPGPRPHRQAMERKLVTP